MDKTLGWLHLSDLHFLYKHDWRASPVLEKLLDDVARLKTNGLFIDLVLCTGDIGYGQASTDPLTAQYADAKAFLDKVLKACGLPNDRLFLVPGNHDIDRTTVLTSQTDYFRNAERNPQDINQMFRDRHGEVQGVMKRLDQYRQFVKDKYPHIPLDDNATFGAWLTINEVKISIAGLNSAWACADNNDKGKLRLAGQAQLHACEKAIKTSSAGSAADIRIALVHHPLAWLNPDEAKQLRGRIQNECNFLLHGHEHDQWVQENYNPYHIVIASGAATADTEGEFGYNLVQLGPGKANIHLRSYDEKGHGWGKEIIASRADDGIWSIFPPPIFSSPDQPDAGTSTRAMTKGSSCPASLGVPGISLPTIGRSEYEVLEKFTLFGGRPIDLSIGFTAIQHAVATHSFDRDLVATLCETIRAPGARIRSFTIRSLPGAGLSLALAQLVRDLFLGADIFGVIDDPDDTCRVLSLLSKEVADSFYSGISACSPRVEHAVIILDDVSKAPPRTINNLFAFRERCKHLANERLGPRITFIFGSFGAARTCSEGRHFRARTYQERPRTLLRADDERRTAANPLRSRGWLRRHPQGLP